MESIHLDQVLVNVAIQLVRLATYQTILTIARLAQMVELSKKWLLVHPVDSVSVMMGPMKTVHSDV
jgi:hypothetical protein